MTSSLSIPVKIKHETLERIRDISVLPEQWINQVLEDELDRIERAKKNMQQVRDVAKD